MTGEKNRIKEIQGKSWSFFFYSSSNLNKIRFITLMRFSTIFLDQQQILKINEIIVTSQNFYLIEIKNSYDLFN